MVNWYFTEMTLPQDRLGTLLPASWHFSCTPCAESQINLLSVFVKFLVAETKVIVQLDPNQLEQSLVLLKESMLGGTSLPNMVSSSPMGQCVHTF